MSVECGMWPCVRAAAGAALGVPVAYSRFQAQADKALDSAVTQIGAVSYHYY
jgi:hypothetical protein